MANDTDTDVAAPQADIPPTPPPSDILNTTRQMPTLGQTAAPVPAQQGAAQQGPYAGIMAGLKDVLSGGLGTQPAQPVGQQVVARHGGLVSGLVGVLLDGLAGGMAPDARTASEMPLIRQQQQMQQQQMQLEQQKMQEEMALEPLRIKAMQAQTLMNIMQATHTVRQLDEQTKLGFSDAQMKSNDAAVEDGRAIEVAKGDYDSVMGQYKQVTAQNKDTALHYGVDVVGRDPNTGDPNQYRLFKYYPDKTLQTDEVFDLPGNKELNVDPIHEVFKAGMREDDRRAREAHLAAIQANQIHMQEESIEQQKLKIEQEKAATYMTPLQTQTYEKIDDMFTGKGGYTEFLRQAKATKGAIALAKDGNELAGSLEPLMTALGVTTFAGVHRINQNEIRAAGPGVGSLLRQMQAVLDKVGTGSVPKETLDEANKIADLLINAHHSSDVAGAQMRAANAGLDPTRIMILNRQGEVATMKDVIAQSHIKYATGKPGQPTYISYDDGKTWQPAPTQ